MTVLQGAETIAAHRYLYGKLNTGIGLGKTFPALAPRDTARPYILYQLMPLPGRSDTVALGGIRVITRLRYLVKVVADSLQAAEPYVKHVDTLQDTEGPQSGYYVSEVMRTEPFELPTVEDDELYWQTGGFYELTVSAGIE